MTTFGFTCNYPRFQSTCEVYTDHPTRIILISLIQAFLYISDLTSKREIISGNFNAIKNFRHSLSAPSTLLRRGFQTHADGWTQHVAMRTRFCKILDEGFTHSDLNAKVSVLKHFNGDDKRRLRLASDFSANGL